MSLTDQSYERQLRALAAWWCLGSSALDPRLLVQYTLVSPARLRAAGL